jgi:hypothetical protein
VRQLLRTSLVPSSSEQTSPFQAHGTIEAVGEGYRLTLLIERGTTHGSRVIESDDCRSLAKAAAIILELLVQKERTLGRELSESEISGRPEQVQEPEVQRTQAPVEQPSPRATPPAPLPAPFPTEPPRPWHVLLRVPEGKLDLLTLPHSGYGVGIGIGVAYRAWHTMLTGTSYPLQSVTTQALHPYTVEYRRTSLNASGCYGWRSGLVEVAPCGVLGADHVRAHASGAYLASQDKSALWLSIGAGLAGYLHVHRYAALVAMGTGRIMTNRARFAVGSPIGQEQAYQVPLGSLELALACEWIF